MTADPATVVVSVALVDSLNPATILPALYLATGRRPVRAVVGFAAGYFFVNVLGGIAALALGRELARHLPHLGHGHLHVIELALGLIAIVASGALWHRRSRVQAAVESGEKHVTRVAPVVGATIAAVELPTALPFFAVIAVLAGSGERAAVQVAFVVLFNVIFLTPVVFIALLRAIASPQIVDMLSLARRFVARYVGVIAAIGVLLLGIALTVIGVAGILSG